MVLLQLLANGLVAGCLNAILALGLGLIYNTAKVFHFAHGAAYAGGAYFFYVFLDREGCPFVLACGLAILLTAFVGILMDVFVYWPLHRRGASAPMGLLSSLGLYVVLVNLLVLSFGNETLVVSYRIGYSVELGPIALVGTQLLQLICSVILLVLVLAGLRFTSWGRQLRAVRDHPRLVEVMGLNLRIVRWVAFALGSGLAAVAAILSSLDVGVDPHRGMTALLTAAVALIVGGIDSFEGPVIGALLLGILQSAVVWQFSTQWIDIVSFACLIVTLLIRPQGLLGRRGRLEEAVL